VRDTVLLWIEKNRGRWLGELKAWLGIPSISAQPDHAGDVLAAAAWAADYLRAIGMRVETIPTARHPCLLATTPEGMAPAGSPHILIYGHYDVQPPEPLELWTTPAFTPTVRAGAGGEELFARGASDDKGQVHCHLAALMAWKEVNHGFPCRISVLLEGEEEIGSPNLMTVVNARRDLLKTAQVLLISDTNIFADGIPSITYGLRGLIGVEFALHGAKTDLHSGMYGGTVANPAHALCEMIAKLHDANGRVTVPGFYDQPGGGVLPVTDAERQMWRTLPHDDARYAADLASPASSARPASLRWNANGPAPPSKSTASPAATRARAAKPSSPTAPASRSPAGLSPTRMPRKSATPSSPTSSPSCPPA